MNRKLVFFTVLFTLVLVSLFAFKQSDTPKKYLTLSYIPIKEMVVITDEFGRTQEKELTGFNTKLVDPIIEKVTVELNAVAAKGYKLVEVQKFDGVKESIQYIFEKE